jgi:hypothetical protein
MKQFPDCMQKEQETGKREGKASNSRFCSAALRLKSRRHIINTLAGTAGARLVAVPYPLYHKAVVGGQ